jgi:hypothetical protein
MRKFWTDKHTKLLIEAIPYYSRKEISKLLSFSLSTIKQQAARLGLKFVSKERRRWTQEEKNTLYNLLEQGVRIQEIAKIINRSEPSLHRFCSENNIKSKLQPIEWSKEEIKNLINLRNSHPDFSYKEIGNILNRSESSVGYQIQKLGTNSEHSQNIILAKELSQRGLKRCIVCNRILDTCEFYISGHRFSSRCKTCAKNESKTRRKKLNINSDVNKILKHRLQQTRGGAKQRKKEVFITLEDLETIFEKQKGKCFYTGKDMSLKINDLNCVSIDRIDSSKDYTLDNIVLCRWVINNMKMQLSVKELLGLCQEIVNHSIK